MKKSVLLLALLFAAFFSFDIHSQDVENAGQQVQEKENASSKNLRVVRFNIDGLKRTRRSYMDNLLAEFLDKSADEKTLKAVETKLQAENLFDQIKVSYSQISEEEAVVDISFKEKWSLIPLPFGYYTGDSFGAGLFVMDMNVLGQHCMATIGGLYSSSGMMGVGLFQKPPAKKGGVGFSVAGNVSKSLHQFANSKNYKVFEYDNFYAGVKGALLFKPTNSTHASVGVGYSFFNPIDSPQVQRRNQWSAEASWGIASSSWNGFFLSVNSFSVGTELLFSDVSRQRFAPTGNFSAQVQRAVIPRLRLMSGCKGFFSNNLLETNYVGRSLSGVTLLPTKFVTDQIFGFYTGFEAALVKTKFGLLSLYGLFELAAAKDWDGSVYSCIGPEGGARFYFSKLAFPAFAMGVAYNINEDVVQFSLSGGASF